MPEMKGENIPVQILLSTWNGEKYLKEQLDSLLAQTWPEWQLLARDDGSRDQSPQILQEYAAKYPQKIKLLPANQENLGASQSFGLLLQKAQGRYFMFCDQDDIWLPDKISLTLSHMLNAEQQNHNLPVLVHSDLSVTNEQLQTIHSSFWRQQKLYPPFTDFKSLLLQNNVTGCTVMINDTLRQLALPLPGRALMHDHWLALLASLVGVIVPLENATILYRQHAQNEIGASQSPWKKFWNSANKRRFHKAVSNNLLQAQALYEKTMENHWPPSVSISWQNLKILKTYASLPQAGRCKRLALVFAFGFFKKGFLKNLNFLAGLLLPRRERE